jgi:protein SCO1/2/putative membrane protein
LLLALALLALACNSGALPANDFDALRQALGPVPPFALTDQNGQTVTGDNLRGKVWIVSFFFTCCAGDCSKTTASMARLQKDLAGYGDVRLVSISVYPEHDTPETLQKYAASHGADPERWLFLTGPEQTVYQLIQKGFLQAVEKASDQKPGYEVNHTFSLMVVDQRGQIRGYIDGRDPEQVARLEGRVKRLVQAIYLPSLNADLNGTCAILLVLGYVAVRRRWIALHKVCMLTALGVSVAFLACYLYYHFGVLDGQPTHFKHEGWVKLVYLGILLSHTLLAVIVAPLALATTYLGLRDRIARHVRLARWTLPLWLYVSVTGVVVYWMLYHLYPPV